MTNNDSMKQLFPRELFQQLSYKKNWEGGLVGGMFWEREVREEQDVLEFPRRRNKSTMRVHYA